MHSAFVPGIPLAPHAPSRARSIEPTLQSAASGIAAPFRFPRLSGPRLDSSDCWTDGETSETPSASLEAIDAAFLRGLAEGESAAAEEIELLQARLAELETEISTGPQRLESVVRDATEALRAAWDSTVRSAEPQLVEIALSVAETVLSAPLSDDQRSIAMSALIGAIDELASRGPVTVQVHPVEFLALQESGLTESLEAAHPGLQWEAVASLDEGDWHVATDEAAILRIRAEILASLRERLDLPAAL